MATGQLEHKYRANAREAAGLIRSIGLADMGGSWPKLAQILEHAATVGDYERNRSGDRGDFPLPSVWHTESAERLRYLTYSGLPWDIAEGCAYAMGGGTLPERLEKLQLQSQRNLLLLLDKAHGKGTQV